MIRVQDESSKIIDPGMRPGGVCWPHALTLSKTSDGKQRQRHVSPASQGRAAMWAALHFHSCSGTKRHGEIRPPQSRARAWTTKILCGCLASPANHRNAARRLACYHFRLFHLLCCCHFPSHHSYWHYRSRWQRQSALQSCLYCQSLPSHWL